MTVYLYCIWEKTNNGPWTYPSNYTPLEVTNVVMPYQKKLFNQPGITASPQVMFLSSTQFMRKFTFDTVEHAIACKKFMTDQSIPEVKAMRELSSRYAKAAGTTYEAKWKLTQTTP